MKYFVPAEFKHFDLMNADFLQYLDAVRAKSNIAFRLTSDYRTEEHNTLVGGSPASLHLLGRAVDFVPAAWDREVLWRIVAACISEAGRRSIELELVQGPHDKHIHLGVFLDHRPSRLVLALD